METISKETKFLLALSKLKGIGPVALKNIAETINVTNLTITDLANTDKKIQKALDSNNEEWNKCLFFAQQQIDYAKEHQTRIISVVDKDYPLLLKMSKNDPVILFVKGKLHNNPENSVGIIGTREPTSHGKIITERITKFFIENNWSIVSGLAIGCDSIAHRIAVQQNAHTVAVLAHGLETIAPKQNEKLAEEILDAGGALISQFPFKSEIRPASFVVRDKVQAGLSKGVVMIQSDIKGGSLHASRAALTYKRWLAVPNPTQQDRNNNEPKIAANIIMIDGQDREVESLLECQYDDLRHIIKLYSKDDYLKLLTIDHNEQFSLI